MKPAVAVFVLLSIFMLAVPHCGLANSICLSTNDPDLYICPPPGGGIARNIDMNAICTRGSCEVCGPGACIVDAQGQVKCSAIAGGAVTVDQHGQALCVGGCLDGRADLCQRLKIGR